MYATGGLTFGLGTRKSEGSTMLGGRAVAFIRRVDQTCFGMFWCIPRRVCCIQELNVRVSWVLQPEESREQQVRGRLDARHPAALLPSRRQAHRSSNPVLISLHKARTLIRHPKRGATELCSKQTYWPSTIETRLKPGLRSTRRQRSINRKSWPKQTLQPTG